MEIPMLVKEVMNRNVKTIDTEANVQKAAELMSKFGIGSLIVVKNNKLKGILTERNILGGVVAKSLDATDTKVKDIMTKEVVFIKPELDVEEAAEIMVDKNIKKLPVILRNQLVGIITASDICAAQPKLMESLSTLLMIPGRRKLVAG